MPFTFSHPAIVLPFILCRRKWFSLTGLVAGSVTPDFEYFIRMRLQSNYSHTAAGLFWFDLPVGILLAFIFHNLVRRELFANLPEGLHKRFARFNDFNWNRYFKANWSVVALSVLIGAASHLLWDGFTHDSGYFVQAIPALLSTINLLGTEVPILKTLQHLSTLIGAIAIAVTVFSIKPVVPVKRKINLNYWLTVIILTCIIIAARIFSGLNYQLYGNMIVSAIAAVLISLTITPVFTRTAKQSASN